MKAKQKRETNGRGKTAAPARPAPATTRRRSAGAAAASSGPAVEALRHKDKRANIPTEELRDFVREEETKPKTIRYPRDPSLDPQLVWKGKDEQDSNDLAVPAVPVYIQEKIDPQAIVAEVRAQARKEKPAAQVGLFADFNGLPFEELVDFYRHGQNWSNRMILGDSLLVMTSLAEKEGLKGKVQMIYVDPPYGIKFGSNWQVSTRKRDVKDGKAEDATRQPEQIRAFRDTWELGIHSYLSYLRDRFVVAREMLTETGSIFVQIGDENVHLVRCVMDEVFGSENFCSLVSFKKTGAQTTTLLPPVCDYLLWYAKSGDGVRDKYHQLFREMIAGEGHSTGERYDQALLPGGASVSAGSMDSLPVGTRLFRTVTLSSNRPAKEHEKIPLEFAGRSYLPPANRTWTTTPEGFKRLVAAGRVHGGRDSLNYLKFLDDFPANPIGNLWEDLPGAPDKVYVVQTNARIVARCLLMTTDPGDLVLDPTCGSGTTAYVAEQWGRRWITIDTSRVALALARTRLMAAKYPYYLLADTPDGAAKEAEITGRPSTQTTFDADVRKGFVYKRVPHVTLKSIANNPDIKEGMTREQIDAAIARHAETETLYDQPYVDGKRVRVAGPFTVESLSPHRVLSAEEERPRTEEAAGKEPTAGKFETMIIENLRKAGVQNTRRNERLEFTRLEPHAGTWVHALGEFCEKDGTTRTVAVSIGPEHGTVGPEQVKEAAKEAMKGRGADLLIVCGFAFDAHAGETAKQFEPEMPSRRKDEAFAVAEGPAKQYGKLPVLPAHMNPDLAMGEELLKKTGAGNLFMVFGEPDIEVKKRKDGKIVVDVRGVDVYDPTTGQVRSSSTDDIACWFLDTDYNGESFFVRHAYFTGGDEPYEKLKRALRAQIDEAAWASLYSTTSRPFDPPRTGKIAVKVINHYGDEVMKVYQVSS